MTRVGGSIAELARIAPRNPEALAANSAPMPLNCEPTSGSPGEAGVAASHAGASGQGVRLRIRARSNCEGSLKGIRASEPVCRTRRRRPLPASHDSTLQGHTVCAARTAAVPLAAGVARGAKPFCGSAFSGHGCYRFVHPDPPELIRFWKI